MFEPFDYFEPWNTLNFIIIYGTLQQLMPESAFKGSKSRDSWTQEVIKEFEKLELNKGKKTPKQVGNILI